MSAPMPRQRLVLIHAFDPRGTKVGGIETHVRQVLRRHPADMRILLIGTDDTGKLELGAKIVITVEGREIDFVPLLHIPPEDQTGAAASIGGSTTFRFAKAMAKRLRTLRRLIKGEAASAEVERFEYAPLARAMGCPLVVLVHLGGDPRTDKMDSILKKHWRVNAAAEWLAYRLARRIFCVSPELKQRVVDRHPSQAKKAEVLSVSVDTGIFKAAPFDLADGKLRLIYAGRLDEFKDPPLMFAVAAELHRRLNGAFEFHYCGSADPTRIEGFAAIESFTVRHGALDAMGVAAAMRHAHIGILTSHHEGMPCFLLELLAAGRPFAGLRLGQFDLVVEEGVNGRMTERRDTPAASRDAVVEVVLQQWDEIRSGHTNPDAVHAKIVPWSADAQLGRLFQAHRDVARKGGAPAAGAVVSH